MLVTLLKRKQAQITMESAAILIIAMAALLVMGVYVKRGIQGRWKASIDEVGDQYDPRQTVIPQMYYYTTSETETRIWTDDILGEGIWTYRRDETNQEEIKRRIEYLPSY